MSIYFKAFSFYLISLQLHFSTPEAYFAIYPPHSGFTKDPAFYARFGVDDSTVGVIDVEKHKKRRDTLSPLFSRRAILKLENVVQEKVSSPKPTASHVADIQYIW